MRRFLQHTGLFILFCLLQTLIFERLLLGPFFAPCVYLLFLLLFPFGYSTFLILLWSFAIGISVDLFSAGALGVHASASICLGLLRSGILKMVTTKGEIGQLTIPGPRTLGTPWYFVYVITSLFVHHTLLFGLESFYFTNLYLIIVRIVCSTILNTLLIALLHTTFFNSKHLTDT